MSRIRLVVEAANASTFPFVVGTRAMFDVTAPSKALRVETNGTRAPSGQSVRYGSGPEGTTVAFKT